MIYVKRYWRQSVLLGLCMLLVGVIFLPLTAQDQSLPMEQSRAAEAREPDHNAILAYQGVQSLRRNLALRNEDLAALGLDAEDASQILSDVQAWHQANQTSLEKMDSQIRDAKRQLRNTMRQINMGPRDESQLAKLPWLRERYQAHLQRRSDRLESLADQLQGRFSSQQRSLWMILRKHGGVSAALLKGQHLHSRKRKQASAETLGEVDSATEITPADYAEIEAAMTRLPNRMKAILTAERETLPTPTGLAEILPAPVHAEVDPSRR